MRTTITSLLTSFILLITTLLSSCVQDLDGGKEQQVITDEMALVTLSLSAPSSPVTRAEATATENAISEVDVLLFNASDNFIYRAHGTSIKDQATVPATDPDPDPYATKKFEVRLPVGTHHVVVLANARAAIAALSLPVATLVSGGASRATVLNSIAASLPAGDKMGKTNFPMWGYLAPVTIDETSSDIASIIDLTRAVVRVDVSLDTDVTNFIIDSVLLYNYHDKGHVAPEATGSGYTTATVYPVTGSKQEDTFIGYAISESTEPGKFLRTIYAFEAGIGTGTNPDRVQNTCLVVGGRYDGSNDITYYRVEFHNDDTKEYLALKRNHLYNVVIDEVSDDGWLSPWYAYTHESSNITVQITAWNDAGMNEVEFNGQHYLAVDKSHVNLYTGDPAGNPATYYQVVGAQTNYSEGWEIEIPTEFEDWLEVTPLSYDGSSGE
ncbi:MAG: hypothetical protein LBF09_01220, partial [Odoribacteraceae bacterium]|nr:hypothetical protein [Odoribacteraceae bacterium]